MKKILAFLLLAVSICAYSCKKDGSGVAGVHTPRTQSVPAELVGRWAITGISGSTVYNIPEGSTFNTNEVFLGYTINPDGTTQEHGYASTYMYGVSTWTKWMGKGSVELTGSAISFHRASGSYTSSRNNSPVSFGANEVYPNKTSTYTAYEVGIDEQGREALFLLDDAGIVHTYIKQ